MVRQGEAVGFDKDPEPNPDIRSLKHTAIFGLRGVAAYTDHAQILGQEDDAVYAALQEILADTLRLDLGLNDWVSRVLRVGEINIRAMELLDAANTGTYAHPVPTKVPLGHRKGKAIVVSGHDLKGSRNCLSKPKARASPCTHTEKCCRATAILA